MSAPVRKRERRPFVAALVVIFNWFGVSGVFDRLFGSLSTVQASK